jgi:DNA-directed RNA polymerase subunit RPC12/RpoP
LICPECASRLITFARKPLSKKIATWSGKKYAKCLNCGNFFPLSHEDARVLEDRELAPQVIEEDFPCRKCGYNLRSLKTGRNCPECGAQIKLLGTPQSHYEVVKAGIIELAICLVFAIYLGIWFFRSGTATEAFAIIVGSAFLFVGARGIRTRSTPLALLRFYPEHSIAGLLAVVLGVVYVLVGVGALTVIGFGWTGILNLKRFGIG